MGVLLLLVVVAVVVVVHIAVWLHGRLAGGLRALVSLERSELKLSIAKVCCFTLFVHIISGAAEAFPSYWMQKSKQRSMFDIIQQQ